MPQQPRVKLHQRSEGHPNLASGVRRDSRPTIPEKGLCDIDFDTEMARSRDVPTSLLVSLRSQAAAP